MVKVEWIIEIRAPADEGKYCEFYQHLRPLLDYTNRLSLPSKPNVRLGISSFEVSFNFCKFLRRMDKNLDILFHVTCYDLDKSNYRERLMRIGNELNVKRLLVVTGDNYIAADRDKQFSDSSELVDNILKAKLDTFVEIAAAAYPGGNQTKSFDNECECLRLAPKLSAGVTTFYTQCLYRVSDYEGLLKELRNFWDTNEEIVLIPSVGLFESRQDLARIQRLTKSSPPDLADWSQGCSEDYLANLCSQLSQMSERELNSASIDLCTFGRFELALNIMKRFASA